MTLNPVHARSPVASSVVDAIGGTPLVRLERFGLRTAASLFAKLEMLNPGGSLKDRPAARMVLDAIEAGRIAPGTTIVESSSGNMAIGLAQVCCRFGLRLHCVVDPRTQPQNLAILRAYGAIIDVVHDPDPETGDYLPARLARVADVLARDPDAYWPNQYANASNPAAHEDGTMREIADALDGRVDHLFVAVSSTGTIGGCLDFVRDNGLGTVVHAVDAHGSVLFGGERGPRVIPGMGAGIVPKLAARVTPTVLHRVDARQCVVGCRRLVATEGILAGGSGGAVAGAMADFAATASSGTTCVAVLADSGTRYVDTIYDDEWVRRTLGPNALEIDITDGCDRSPPAGS